MLKLFKKKAFALNKSTFFSVIFQSFDVPAISDGKNSKTHTTLTLTVG